MHECGIALLIRSLEGVSVATVNQEAGYEVTRNRSLLANEFVMLFNV